LNHDSAKAEAQFKAARTIDGNSEDAVLNMARLYSEQGQTQQAVDALTTIPADDRSARIDFALGAAYDQMHRPREAAAAYKAALDEDGDNPDGQRALAAALLASNQPDEALKVYQDLVKADPSDLASTLKIAVIQNAQGHAADALATIKRAKALPGAGDSLELSFTEAAIYESLSKYDQAAAILQSVLTSTTRPDGKYSDADKSNRATFLDRLAIIQKEQGKIPEAIATYKQIVALGGDFQVLGYQGEVNVYNDAHQYKDTLAVATEAAKALPNNRGVQMLLAFQLAINGQGDRALALADKQLDGSASDLDTHVSIANIDLELHRPADALSHLDKADALATNSDQRQTITLLRATVLDRDKQYAAAEVQYRKVLALDPNSASALNDFGYMLADRDDRVPEALTMIQKAVALEPTNGAYLDSLGWAYFRLGQYALAETNLMKAIERTPSDASIHDHLGQVYEKTGRLKLAVAQWERSMTEYARTVPADVDASDVAKVKHELDEARTKLARVGQAPNKKS
jgi:tetratricopeptide (TPR) repeat protein